VFLSHINEEVELALIIRDRLTSSFLAMIEVFVAGEVGSVPLGDEWLDRVVGSLETCDVMLVLCSQASVRRPWINFEVGSGWTRKILVIPICHTDIQKTTLPLPLSLRQGINANQPEELKKLYVQMADVLDSAVPEADFVAFGAEVADFEKRYGFYQKIRDHVAEISRVAPDLESLFQPGSTQTRGVGEIPLTTLNALRPHLEWLREQGMITYGTEGAPKIAWGDRGSDFLHQFSMTVEDAYREIAQEIMNRP
jgi:hypothetical protein